MRYQINIRGFRLFISANTDAQARIVQAHYKGASDSVLAQRAAEADQLAAQYPRMVTRTLTD